MINGKKPLKPSLSDYDVDNFDDYSPMQSGTWNKGKGAYRVKVTHQIDDSDTIGLPGRCWCGLVYGHDWLDRANGAPHPDPTAEHIPPSSSLS